MPGLEKREHDSDPRVREFTPKEAVRNRRLLELFSAIAELTKEFEERDRARAASICANQHLTVEKANDSKDGLSETTALILHLLSPIISFLAGVEIAGAGFPLFTLLVIQIVLDVVGVAGVAAFLAAGFSIGSRAFGQGDLII